MGHTQKTNVLWYCIVCTYTGRTGHTSSSSLKYVSSSISLVLGIEHHCHAVPRKLVSEYKRNITTIIFTLQVLSNLPTLPETEQHLRPFPLHLTANPSTSHKVSCLYHVYSRTKKTSFLHQNKPTHPKIAPLLVVQRLSNSDRSDKRS